MWNPVDRVIVGGYRFLLCDKLPLDEHGQVDTPTSELFHYSERFVKEYLPDTIELGRSFVQPAYQPTKSLSKGLYSLDNLWDGLVAIIMKNPNLLYYFGKITLYPSYDHIMRDLTYHFLWKHFGDKDELVRPWDDQAIMPASDPELMNLIVHQDDLLEDYKLLKAAARMRGVNIPPNMTAYISITSQMLMFGTAVNHLMHNIEDTSVLIPFDAIYHDKKTRHIGAYLRFLNSRRRQNEVPNFMDIEEEMIENWLITRNRKVKRMLKKAGRTF